MLLPHSVAHRIEQDREDLLAEATALVERIEISAAGFPERIVAGFRKGGATSVFFGQDQAYHFTSAGELRRAYADGLLYKAERRRLVALDRLRTEAATELRRHELTDQEQAAFLERLSDLLAGLRSQLRAGGASVRGQVPTDADVLARTLAWLDGLSLPPAIAIAPNLR